MDFFGDVEDVSHVMTRVSGFQGQRRTSPPSANSNTDDYGTAKKQRKKSSSYATNSMDRYASGQRSIERKKAIKKKPKAKTQVVEMEVSSIKENEEDVTDSVNKVSPKNLPKSSKKGPSRSVSTTSLPTFNMGMYYPMAKSPVPLENHEENKKISIAITPGSPMVKSSKKSPTPSENVLLTFGFV